MNHRVVKWPAIHGGILYGARPFVTHEPFSSGLRIAG